MRSITQLQQVMPATNIEQQARQLESRIFDTAKSKVPHLGLLLL